MHKYLKVGLRLFILALPLPVVLLKRGAGTAEAMALRTGADRVEETGGATP
jgi:hypothetical protein